MRFASCLAPLALVTVAALGCDVEDTYGLGDRPDPLMTCASMPGAPGCDCAEGSTLDDLHWAPSRFVETETGARCLAVVLDPELEAFADEVQAALDVWAGLDCSGLCFAGPTVGQVDPSDVDSGTLFLRPVSNPVTVSRAEISFEQDSLRILSARIDVDPDRVGELDADVRVATLAAEVGRAIGLSSAAPGTPSILASRFEDLVSEPTEADVAAFCKRYGEGGVCGIPPR